MRRGSLRRRNTLKEEEVVVVAVKMPEAVAEGTVRTEAKVLLSAVAVVEGDGVLVAVAMLVGARARSKISQISLPPS